jgi:hypothetical protein
VAWQVGPTAPSDAFLGGLLPGQKHLPAPTLISTLHGPIRRVLFTVPYWVLRYGHQAEVRPYRDAYEALLTRLPEQAERVVVTHAEAARLCTPWVDGLGIANRTSVVVVPDDEKFTVWAQDPCVVGTSGRGEPHLVSPASFARDDDALVLHRVADQLGLKHTVSQLAFQGGNILVGDDFWLVGEDALRRTVAEGLAGDRAAAERLFVASLETRRTLRVVNARNDVPGPSTRHVDPADASWQESVHTGNYEGSRQPLFDIDTFISLAGRGDDGVYRLLVGDPRLAAQLTRTPLPDHALADAFDDVAAQLDSLGFRVLRNPLPLVFRDDRVLRIRWWYFATSNNVIAEIDGDTKRVWLPTYGDADFPELASIDARNEEIWEGLGFSVERLTSFHVFARGLGAAHCICKCLARGCSASSAVSSRA